MCIIITDCQIGAKVPEAERSSLMMIDQSAIVNSKVKFTEGVAIVPARSLSSIIRQEIAN